MKSDISSRWGGRGGVQHGCEHQKPPVGETRASQAEENKCDVWGERIRKAL